MNEKEGEEIGFGKEKEEEENNEGSLASEHIGRLKHLVNKESVNAVPCR